MTVKRLLHSPAISYDALRRIIQRTYPAYDLEIRDGEYVVVAPHDAVSSNVVIRLGSLLDGFVRANKLGHVFDSNGGIQYPDGDKLAPDVAYVSRERLPVLPRTFARVIPELVVEIRSGSQTQRATRNKLASLLAKGSSVGLYVDPGTHVVEVHRLGAEPVILGDGDRVEIPDLLPGFGFAVAELWPQ